ncbi:MAG: hypothetical protein QMD46_11425 [Methanomicrobiales archaeon]|nr:hypothetical protein [Methanomicrobiales archaeon]MDI6876976.1 hypothetical protein [Methanomicrobiales archaeon]
MRQSLLFRAFSGRRAPTEAELARREGREYEPASVLLERTRSERRKKMGRREVSVHVGMRVCPLLAEEFGISKQHRMILKTLRVCVYLAGKPGK